MIDIDRLRALAARPAAAASGDLGGLVGDLARELLTIRTLPKEMAKGQIGVWQPIATAPRDGVRPLYLARFSDAGELQDIDFDGSWESESESWEISQVYWLWKSAFDRVEEPTHWAYQDGPPPTEPLAASKKEEAARLLTLECKHGVRRDIACRLCIEEAFS